MLILGHVSSSWSSLVAEPEGVPGTTLLVALYESKSASGTVSDSDLAV